MRLPARELRCRRPCWTQARTVNCPLWWIPARACLRCVGVGVGLCTRACGCTRGSLSVAVLYSKCICACVSGCGFVHLCMCMTGSLSMAVLHSSARPSLPRLISVFEKANRHMCVDALYTVIGRNGAMHGVFTGILS
jgi:hypothetical protein